jgi:hypothetical protein
MSRPINQGRAQREAIEQMPKRSQAARGAVWHQENPFSEGLNKVCGEIEVKAKKAREIKR